MIDDLPKGFKAGAAAANFKKAGRDDLGLIISDRPCVLAGMFTQNLFKAAPVLVCREILDTFGTARAVLANSGQANACTGEEGLDNCRATQEMAAEATGLEAQEILPISTGVVGAHLKMDLWRKACLLYTSDAAARLCPPWLKAWAAATPRASPAPS